MEVGELLPIGKEAVAGAEKTREKASADIQAATAARAGLLDAAKDKDGELVQVGLEDGTLGEIKDGKVTLVQLPNKAQVQFGDERAVTWALGDEDHMAIAHIRGDGVAIVQ